MAWTDWQYTAPADAKANLAALKLSQITGQATVLVISGVRTEFSPHTKNSGLSIAGVIRDLQRYLFEISENDWDWQSDFNPNDRARTVTPVVFQ